MHKLDREIAAMATLNESLRKRLWTDGHRARILGELLGTRLHEVAMMENVDSVYRAGYDAAEDRAQAIRFQRAHDCLEFTRIYGMPVVYERAVAYADATAALAWREREASACWICHEPLSGETCVTLTRFGEREAHEFCHAGYHGPDDRNGEPQVSAREREMRSEWGARS